MSSRMRWNDLRSLTKEHVTAYFERLPLFKNELSNFKMFTLSWKKDSRWACALTTTYIILTLTFRNYLGLIFPNLVRIELKLTALEKIYCMSFGDERNGQRGEQTMSCIAWDNPQRHNVTSANPELAHWCWSRSLHRQQWRCVEQSWIWKAITLDDVRCPLLSQIMSVN